MKFVVLSAKSLTNAVKALAPVPCDTYVNLRLRPEPRISFTIDVVQCRFIGFLSLLKSEFEREKAGFEAPALDGVCKGFFRLLCGPALLVVSQ
jgi:hypothetical protein